MNIKIASETTGVSPDTIRYYERIGLIPPVKRSKGGIREFEEEDLRWIKFSRQMRNAGLSIENLIEYLSLFREGDETVLVRKQLLAEQIEELKGKAKDINEALSRLEYKLEHYDNHLKPFENGLRNK